MKTKKILDKAIKKSSYPLYYFTVEVEDKQETITCYSTSQKAAERSVNGECIKRYGKNNYKIIDISVL